MIAKLFIVFLIISSLLLTTACPKRRSVIVSAANASYRLTGLTGNLIATTEAEFRAGRISPAAKDRIADALVTLTKAEIVFIQAVKEAEMIYRAQNQMELGALARLEKMFTESIAAPFLAIVQMLLPYHSATIEAAVNGLRTVVVFISGRFREAQYG